ncbi:MAG: hypothetical protein M1339_05445 [Bacteroidetes bacterium]|nr:hypothetical protein [Bacteroidota bacterium]
MLQQIEKKTSKVPVSGTIERVNEKGIKVNGEWFNFSKFMSNVPVLREGDKIEFKSSKNFINEVSKVTPTNGPAKSAAAAPKASEAAETSKNESKTDGPGPSNVPPSPNDPPRKDEPAGDTDHGQSDRDELLKCLKDAVRITEQVDSARFSTQDIIKLALTLFIHRTA